MGCIWSVPSKKKPPRPRGTSDRDTGHSQYPKQAPCHLKFEVCGDGLIQTDEQQVQKPVEMGSAEADERSALEAVNGDEILFKTKFEVCGEWLIQTDEQQVQKPVEMGSAEADVRSALEAVNGDEILFKTKLWQPDEQQVQNLAGMGFAEAGVRSALEAVSGDEILDIQMLCLPKYAPAGNDRER